MSWVTWILSSTLASVIVDPDDIAYIEEDTADPTRCFVGLVAGGNPRIQIDRTAALAAADVHTATGIVVIGYPVAPLVEVAKTGEPTRSLFFRGSTVASLTATDTAVTLVDTQGPEQPWSIAVAAATLSTDLQAAAGSGSSGGTTNLVLATWVADDVGTVLALDTGGRDITVPNATVNPDNTYDYTLGGADLPSGFIALIQSVGLGPCSSYPSGPNTLRVTLGRSLNFGGRVETNVLTPSSIGCTLDTYTPGSGTYVFIPDLGITGDVTPWAMPAGTSAPAIDAVAEISGGNLVITVTDRATGLPTDGSFFFGVGALSGVRNAPQLNTHLGVLVRLTP